MTSETAIPGGLSDDPAKTYTVSDGDLVLDLYRHESGLFTVVSPMVPGLVTEGRTIDECFEMARDARTTLWRAWAANRETSAAAS